MTANVVPDNSKSAKPQSQRKTFGLSVMYSYLNMVATAIQQLLVVPVLVLTVGRNEYALIALYLSVSNTFVGLFGWVSAASAKLLSDAFHTDSKETYQNLSSSLIWFHRLAGLAVIPIALLFYLTYVKHFFAGDGAEDFGLFFWATLSACALLFTTVELTALLSVTRPDELNKYRFYSAALVCGVAVFGVSRSGQGYIIFLALIAGTLMNYFLCRQFMRENHPDFQPTARSFSFALLRPIIRKFGPFALLTSLGRTLLLVDLIWLGIFLPTQKLAEYSFYWLPANFVILALWRISENAQPFFMQRFARSDRKGARQLYKRLEKTLVMLSLISALLYYLILPEFLSIWVQFDSTSRLAAICFAAQIFFLGLFRLDYAVLYSKLNYRVLLIATLGELGIKLLFIPVLVPWLGCAASAAAHCVAHLLFVQWYAKFHVVAELKNET